MQNPLCDDLEELARVAKARIDTVCLFWIAELPQESLTALKRALGLPNNVELPSISELPVHQAPLSLPTSLATAIHNAKDAFARQYNMFF